MKKKNNSNQFGFTLVEIMVAAGLLGVLSVAVVNIIDNINKTSKRATQIFNIQQERQRLARLLSDPVSCMNTLGNLDLGSNSSAPKQFWAVVPVNDIKNSDDNIVYSIGDEIGEGADVITVDNIRIRRPRDGSDNPTGTLDEYEVGTDEYTKISVTLEAFFKKGRAATSAAAVKQNTIGQAISRAKIPMQIVVHRSGPNEGQIYSCFGDADQFLNNACENLGGVIDVDGDCKDLKIRTIQTTPTTNSTNAATIGDSFSASIVNEDGNNSPIKVTLGGSDYMSIDDDAIQTKGKPLNLNPWGRVEIGQDDPTAPENSNAGWTSSANPGSPLLKLMDYTSAYGRSSISFDTRSIQGTRNGAANLIMLNPYGGTITVGSSAVLSSGLASLDVYGDGVFRRNVAFNNGTMYDVNFNSNRTYFRQGATLSANKTLTVETGANIRMNGTSYINFQGTSYMNFASDRRYKHDIVELESVLEKFDEIRGVEFVWNANNRRDIGYIAQEIEKVFPEVVSTDEKGMKSVQYTKMPAVNTAAIKELKRENDELKFRVNLLMNALCNGEDAHKYEEVCSIPVAPLE
ncbi:tail fiber domain-containing protein [Halobacteriovorax sp. HFRX-2_2]|uniref:tail fiber domain-containing protein n=1 Tax=unclassified Halobacteriovorax TaxID=2639665 RepID=UPI00371142FE